MSVTAAGSLPDNRPHLVVVGNGMAAIRTLEELLAIAPDAYRITVVGQEPHGNYNRILLSPVLAGEKQFEEIVTHPRAWYSNNGVALLAGDPAVAIHRPLREVVTQSGTRLKYDRLLLATGSSPFILPIPGADLAGVVAFRNMADVDTMLDVARNHRNAVVIGGGLLGLEAAVGLKKQGMDVTVVHVADFLMERQLDKPAAQLLQDALEKRGLKFLLTAFTAELLPAEGEPPRVGRLRFKNGEEIAADLVVMAAGVRPNIALAQGAGLHCERALVVDDTLQTLSDPRVYAVGECIQHRKAIFGLVAPVWEQARVAAAHLAGAGNKRYVQTATATKLKVTGVDLYSAGDYMGGPGTEALVFKDPRRGVYKRLVVKGDVLVGAVLYGDVNDGAWYFELIQSATNIARMRNTLVFGKTYCQPQTA